MCDFQTRILRELISENQTINEKTGKVAIDWETIGESNLLNRTDQQCKSKYRYQTLKKGGPGNKMFNSGTVILTYQFDVMFCIITTIQYVL